MEEEKEVMTVAGMQFDELSKIRVLDPEKHEVCCCADTPSLCLIMSSSMHENQ